MWKFAKGFNVRDLKAHLEAKPEPLGLPGEVLPSEQAAHPPKLRPLDRQQPTSPESSGRGSGGRRASLLIPGKESPRWLSLQQVITKRSYVFIFSYMMSYGQSQEQELSAVRLSLSLT